MTTGSGSRLCVGQDFRRVVGSVKVEGQLVVVSLMARAVPGKSVSEVQDMHKVFAPAIFESFRTSMRVQTPAHARARRTRLRYLEVRVGVGEDPFPKVKGLITDLINRLQAEGSEASHKSCSDPSSS